MRIFAVALGVILLLAGNSMTVGQITDPTITNWAINTTGATGSSPDEAMDALVSEILADVETVHYTDDFVYIHTSGVPSYPTGPFPGNPAYASDVDVTYQISRSPVADTSGNNRVLGLGVTGIWVDGIAFYNFGDGLSYNNQGIWNQDANVFELGGFDSGLGHPSPAFGGGGGGPGGGGPGGGGPGGGGTGGGGTTTEDDFAAGYYHNHQNPISLRQRLGDDGTDHSPLLGFAYDGFPVYGPYAYTDPADSTSAIKLIKSSYALRDITDRTTLADGTVLPEAMWGPALADAALGSYQEDFVFVASHGDLDSHNGRFGITPEYPQGTYAYFVTLNDDGTSAFPHIIGTTYYGVVEGGANAVIPDDAIQFIPIILGDVGQDGKVDFLDINPFISLLTADGFLEQADCNQDGVVDFFDILPFIAILSEN